MLKLRYYLGTKQGPFDLAVVMIFHRAGLEPDSVAQSEPEFKNW